MSIKQTILNRKFQIIFLVCACLLFAMVQLSIFKQSSTLVISILCIMPISFLVFAGILFALLNAKRLRQETPPWISYMSTYRISMAIFFLCYSFGALTEKQEDNGNGHLYTSSVTHHCEWCGNEYHHTGYFHVANECVHPQEDIGTDVCCSQKCCMDSWNSRR